MRSYRLRMLLLAALALVVAPASAQVSDGTIRISVLTDFERDLADAAGLGSVLAAEFAVADHGSTLAAVEVDAADNTRSARGARAVARERLDGGADLFVGLAGDAAAEAVQQVAGSGAAVVMTVGATSQQITGSYCGSTGFHWSPDLSVLMHLTDPDKRRERGAGTMFVYGGGRRDTLRNTYEVGSSQWGRNVAGQVFVSDIRHIGLYATAGMTLIAPYYWDANPASRAFAERFRTRFGAPPTYIQAGVYSAVRHYLRAVSAAGTDDPNAVAESIREIQPADFYARNARIREDGQLIQDVYLLEVKQPSESAGSWDYLRIEETLPGGGLYAPMALNGCRPAEATTAER